MKKVINITLGTIVFAIEEDAYTELAVYLERIKSSLSANDDYSEILSDIESAIAEKFVARKRSDKRAVSVTDVATVTAEMGNPADFGDDASDLESSDRSVPVAGVAETSDVRKRLYRDTDDVIIAGVASGLAKYFDVDPVIVRIVFLVSLFFNGLGFLAYVILWLVVPKAETTEQKYAMQGNKVTLQEITERVKKNLHNFETVDREVAKGLWVSVRQFFEKVFAAVAATVRLIVPVFRWLFGLIFMLGGSLALAGMVSVYSIVLLSDKTFVPAEAYAAIDIMLGSALGIVAIGASFVMMAIPLLVLIVAGASLLAGRSLFTLGKSITLAVVWIVAVTLAFTTSFLQLEKVLPVIDSTGYGNDQYQIFINVSERQ